jgi:hypothetical protein
MQVKVLKEVDGRVEFWTEFGLGIATIEKAVCLGEILEVEFDTQSAHVFGKEIQLSTSSLPRISFDGSTTFLTGRLESITTDSIWVVRVGSDLLMIEVLCETPTPEIGTMLEIQTDSLQLYPYSL